MSSYGTSKTRNDATCIDNFHMKSVDNGKYVTWLQTTTFEIKTKKYDDKYYIRIYPRYQSRTHHNGNIISDTNYKSNGHTIIKHNSNTEIFYVVSRVHDGGNANWHFLNNSSGWNSWYNGNYWKRDTIACQFYFLYPGTDERMTHSDLDVISKYQSGTTIVDDVHLYDNKYYWGRTASFIGYPK